MTMKKTFLFFTLLLLASVICSSSCFYHNDDNPNEYPDPQPEPEPEPEPDVNEKYLEATYTSNCFMVRPGQSVDIPILKAYAMWNLYAEWLGGEDFTSLVPEPVLLWQDLPGLITNNMMERAFSWKRLLCALMIPLTIGAATGGFAWGAGAFGTDGLAVNDSYQSANGHPDWKGVKNDEAKKADDLGGVVRQLGEDIANRVGKAAGDAIDKALSTGMKAWQWLSGGDGKGNVFEKTGQAAGDLWSSLFG